MHIVEEKLYNMKGVNHEFLRKVVSVFFEIFIKNIVDHIGEEKNHILRVLFFGTLYRSKEFHVLFFHSGLEHRDNFDVRLLREMVHKGEPEEIF